MTRRQTSFTHLAAAVLLAAVSAGGRAWAADEAGLVRQAPAGLSGAWTLDLALSDDPAEKMREAAESHHGGGGSHGGGGRGGFGGGGGRGGFGGGGRGGHGGGGGDAGGNSGSGSGGSGEWSGTPNEMLWDVHRLVVTDGLEKDPKFVVEMGDGSKRTLFTDGRKVEEEEATGTTTIHAKRKGGKVVVDTEYPNGREVLETWELLANPRLLVVTTKISGKRGTFTFKRVWDPELESVPGAAPAAVAAPPGTAVR